MNPDPRATGDAAAGVVGLFRNLHYGSGRWGVRARAAMLVFDLLSITYFVVSTFSPHAPWVVTADLVLGALLTVEFMTRVIAERDRLAFLASSLAIVDLLIIASLLAPALAGSFVFLRVLRALRIVRMFYVLRELRGRFAFLASSEEIVTSALNLLVFIFVVTAVVYELQADINPEINNYVDALYFTIATLTTTGFGDITLVGSTGRLLAIVIMIVGVSLFLRLAQAIFRPAKVRYECSVCGLARHDPDAVHCKHCGNILHIVTEGD